MRAGTVPLRAERVWRYAAGMPRWFFITVTLFGLAAAASFAAAEDDPLGTILRKIGEGGMWTILIVFIGLALVVGYLRRNADGTLRTPRE